MKCFLVISGLVAATMAAPQGVTDPIPPPGELPKGCSSSYDGPFEITVAQVQDVKRGLIPHVQKRATASCGGQGILVMTLKDGIAKDSLGRTGYIASNEQFQFDDPPQAGAKYTSGFSICENSILALGSSKTFYRCLSGDFYNLYDKNWAAQCEPVHILAIPCGSNDAAAVSQIPDGQIIGTSLVQTTYVSTLPDGQPQVITTAVPVPICEIDDGQLQYHTTPCASVPTTSYVPVSQYSDGQIQVTGVTPGSNPSPTGPAETPFTPTTSAVFTSVPAPPAETAPVPMPSSTLASSAPAGTPTEVTTPKSTPQTTAAPPTPPTAGSTRLMTSSVGALVVGLLVSFVCL